MTAPAGAEGSRYATNGHAAAQREAKAKTLATWCWTHGVDGNELSGLDEAQRRRVARSAGVNPPSTWATWAVVVTKLDRAEQRPEMAGKFGTVETPEWVRTTENDPSQKNSSASPKEETRGAGGPGAGLGGSPEAGGIPALVSDGGELTPYGEALEASIAAHPAGRGRGDELLPKGWAVLAEANVELGHGRVCGVKGCGTPAIAALLTTFRCAVHPPRQGDWGHNLDWTPRSTGSCPPARCYCGSCPTYRLAPVPSIPTPRDEKRGRR